MKADQLSRHQQALEARRLYYLYGTYKAAAEEMGISPRQVRELLKPPRLITDSQIRALDAMAERFDTLTDITFLSVEQETAIWNLIHNAAGTLMVRKRTLRGQYTADTIQALAEKEMQALRVQSPTAK